MASITFAPGTVIPSTWLNEVNGLLYGTSSPGPSVIRTDTSGNFYLYTNGGKLGYGDGTGNSVSQTTSKSTAVTINTAVGRIITTLDAMTAGSTVTFLVNNSLVKSADLVIVNLKDNASHTNYEVKAFPSDTYFKILLKNVSGSTLSDQLFINFAIIRGTAL